MARVSKEELNNVFEDYCKAMGKRVAKAWNDVGGWMIDHGSMGVMTVGVVSNKSGGIGHPVGERYYTPSEFVAVLRFATRSIQAKKR